MLDIDFHSIDGDGRAILAANRDLRVVFANDRAAASFADAGGPLEGLTLAALFGPAGTADGSIGRAVLAAETVALFVAPREGDDFVRADAEPLPGGLTLIALDPHGWNVASDGPFRVRVRALTNLAEGFRDAADGTAAAQIAETVVGNALAARASYVRLVRPRAAHSPFTVGEKRGPSRRHSDLVIPDRVRAGDILAVDDLRRAPLAAGDVARIRARGTAALLWVTLVRGSSRVAAMLVEADEPRRWQADAVGLVASILDRTDLMQARLDTMAATTDAEERFRVLVDAAAAAFWETAADGSVAAPSPSWCDLTGQSAADMMGGGWMNAIHPTDRERARAAWLASVGSGTPFDAEVRLDVPGRPRWMNLKAAPLRRGGSSVAAWVGMAIDMSARKSAEEERSAGETRLRTLLEGIPQLVWRAVSGTGRTWSSPQWCRTTGQTLAESLGAGWLDAVHPDDRAATVDGWRLATADTPLDVEHRIRDVSAGGHRWFQTRATAVVDASGSVVEWLGTCTDIDELRRLEDDRRHFVAELQHRTRNLMAVVQSIVRQSLPLAASPDAFATALERRLKCLSRVQGLLSRGSRDRITLGDLVRMEMDALIVGPVRERVAVEGPAVPLRRSTVQLLTLTIHELVENAHAHGALSNSEGHLSVRWAVADREGAKAVNIVWEERFGATRDDTRRRPIGGYGRDLVENALAYSLSATVSLDVNADRLRYAITLPFGDARGTPGP